MKLQTKIILGLVVTVGLIVALVFSLTKILDKPAEQTQNNIVISDPRGPEPPESSPYSFEEGYQIDLVKGWELVNSDETRVVDRYRFENNAGGILTLSLYENGLATNFTELIDRRYGSAVLSGQEDLQINGLPAKRVFAEFLVTDGTNSGADVLVQIDDQTFVSVYGIHRADGENAINTTADIDFMQQSFRVL